MRAGTLGSRHWLLRLSEQAWCSQVYLNNAAGRLECRSGGVHLADRGSDIGAGIKQAVEPHHDCLVVYRTRQGVVTEAAAVARAGYTMAERTSGTVTASGTSDTT
jgi:hypothetical protein